VPGLDLEELSRYSPGMNPSRDVARGSAASDDGKLATNEDWDVPAELVIDLDAPASSSSRGAEMGMSPPPAKTPSAHECSEYLTKQETADRLKVNTKTVERAIIAGDLPAYKVLNRVRVCRDELEEWISERRIIPSIHDI